MNLFLGILSVVLVVVSGNDVCYQQIETACGNVPVADGDILRSCNATYGDFGKERGFLQSDLQSYAMAHINANFHFLKMSAYFGNYEANREGFKKLYRKLSDDAWEKGMSIIKYITKRGGEMNFGENSRILRNVKTNIFEMSEISSLARALDITKKLAEEALHIHNNAMHNNKDAAIGHFLEEEFMEYQTEKVRQLSGFTTELKKLLGGKNKERDASLSLYLFDQYLEKAI